MKPIKRIRWAHTKSPLVRQYGLTNQLTKGTDSDIVIRGPQRARVELRSPNGGTTVGMSLDGYCTPATLQAVDQLHAIPGVVETITRLYEINVHIAPSFDWEEVHPQIMRVLTNVYYGGGDVEVNVPYRLSAFHPMQSFGQVFAGSNESHVVGTSICPYCVLVEDEKSPRASLLNTGEIWCLHCNRISPGPVNLMLLDYSGITDWFRRMIGILTSQLTCNYQILLGEPAFTFAKKGGQNYQFWLKRTHKGAEELLFITLVGSDEAAAAPPVEQNWGSESDSLNLKLWHLGFSDDKDDAPEESYHVEDVTFKRSWTRTDPKSKTITRAFLYRRSSENVQ